MNLVNLFIAKIDQICCVFFGTPGNCLSTYFEAAECSHLSLKVLLLFKVNHWQVSQIILQGLHEAGMRGHPKRLLKFNLNLKRVQKHCSQVVSLCCQRWTAVWALNCEFYEFYSKTRLNKCFPAIFLDLAFKS